MFRFRRFIITAAICISSMLLSGCATTTQGGAVGADRKQLLLVSSAQLNQLSTQSYLKLKSEAQSKGTLNQNHALLQRVRTIAHRIQSQTQVFRPDAPGWNWEVNIISSNELNAFCMPGGKIMLYSGLISKLQLSDDEIAVVMGHEISHALREHSREQVSRALAAQTTLELAAMIFGLSEGAGDIAGAAYQSLIATKFSRTNETEADRMGLELAARAGYDPRAGVSLWKKMMQENSNGGPPQWLSSHPAGATRVRDIESLLPVVKPFYESSKASFGMR